MTENLTKALRRIKELQPRPPESIDPGALMQKYRRDMKSINEERGTNFQVFFNAVHLLEDQEIADAHREEFEEATENIKNAYAGAVCRNYLAWALALDSGEPLASRYPDLFEPLVQIVESGIQFGLHKGELIVGHLAFPR